jgi:DNA-binding transcriptional ArsR family regulator
MRITAPSLLPVLRSRLVGDLLALVLLEPDRRWTISELSERLRVPYPTLTREMRRLEMAGLVVTEHIGRSKLVHANLESPYARPLAELVTIAFGPPQVLGEEFADVPGIEGLAIFGSFAARAAGEPGPAPADIDVLVLGRPDRDEVYAAARRAEQRLGRPVNTTVRSSDAWELATDGFARQVKSSPMLAIDGPWSAYAARRGEVGEG